MVSRTEKLPQDKRALGPHWVLDTRISEEDAIHGKTMMESDYQTYWMVLEADGKLTTVLHVNQYRTIYPEYVRGTTEVVTDSNYVSESEFANADVIHFDYEKVRYHWTPKGYGKTGGEAMNDAKGNRLQKHAKGVGLSLRLKELSTGPLQARPWYNKHLR